MRTRNPARLLALYEQEVRRRPLGGTVERTDRVIRVIADGWRALVWSDLDAASADAVIAGEVERFAALGSWEWKLYSHDRPVDLPDRLRRAGFVPEPSEALLVADLAALQLDSPVPAGVELLPVEDEAGVHRLMQVHDDVYGRHDDDYAQWILTALRSGQTAAVVAMAGDRPISGGRLDYQERLFAGLFGGSTVPDWRGRGVFRAVVGWRARLAAEHGYRYLHVDASDQSRPILERLGFVHLATTTPFTHP